MTLTCSQSGGSPESLEVEVDYLLNCFFREDGIALKMANLATLRENPAKFVQLLVGPTGKIPRSTLRGVQGIRRSPKMCQDGIALKRATPPKFNMEPENGPLEKARSLLETIIVRFYVKLQGFKFINNSRDFSFNHGLDFLVTKSHWKNEWHAI